MKSCHPKKEVIQLKMSDYGSYERETSSMNENHFKTNKWVRSQDGWVAGVCEGLGNNFGIEPMFLRIAWIVSLFFFGLGALLYLGLYFSLPTEDQVSEANGPKILGVCYHISLKTGLDIGLVRILALILAVASFGATLVGYFVLYFVLALKTKKQDK